MPDWRSAQLLKIAINTYAEDDYQFPIDVSRTCANLVCAELITHVYWRIIGHNGEQSKVSTSTHSSSFFLLLCMSSFYIINLLYDIISLFKKHTEVILAPLLSIQTYTNISSHTLPLSRTKLHEFHAKHSQKWLHNSKYATTKNGFVTISAKFWC